MLLLFVSSFEQNGIFNVGEALGAEATGRGKRPLSGQLKHADSLRARPRSAGWYSFTSVY